MVKRDGQVALQQNSANNIPRQVEVDGVTYTPALRYNVILVWVLEEHAEKIINSPKNKEKSCNCNGGTFRPQFFYASQINVNIFETGNR